MTPETRTIDLSALATELEAAKWEPCDASESIRTFTYCEDGLLTRRRRCIRAEHNQIVIAYERQYFRDGTWWPDGANIVITDPVWQSALGIVQRHIASTEGAADGE